MTTITVPYLPSTAPAGLRPYVAARAISAADVTAVARLLAVASREGEPLLPDLPAWIAMCLALRASRDGHTCVPLTDMAVWAADLDVPDDSRIEWPADSEAWDASLRTAGKLVGTRGQRVPFILDDARLYVARTLHEELEIARRLQALGDRLEILLGGPGTGKTTTVAIRLVDMFQGNPDIRIALAAPTGKAAARMAEALQQRLSDENAPQEVKDAPQSVRDAIAGAHPETIHKLLGMRPRGTPRYKFHAKQPLPYGLVVIDEASMLSSSLTYHLLDALGEKTRLLLVGDPDQLASVDAGSVLGDIAKAEIEPTSPLHGRADRLTIRHRFGPRIGVLADAILRGEAGSEQAFEILEKRWTYVPDPHNETADDPESVAWVKPKSDEFKKLLDDVVKHAQQLRKLAKQGVEGVQQAVAAHRTLQVLCAHREGRGGVTGFNALVEQRLGLFGSPQWYSGRPVLVTANNRALGLHNGDIGLIVPGEGERKKEAVFQEGGKLRRVPVSRLEQIDTVHALTIHKSQGSEYGHAIVVLPEKPSRILTRELLYTGVTRARDKVTIVGSREVIEEAIKKSIRRATGLTERLCRG